jgi:DNA-binding PucR family transcriptional regulator
VSTICMFELVQIIDRRDELAAALEQVNIVVHAYADRVCERITKLYYAERERWLREQGTERLDMLRALVAGQHMDLREVESTLGYGLGGEHLGIVAWHAAGNPMGNELLRVQVLIEAYSERLGCRDAPLIVACDDATVWAWLPLAGIERKDLDAALENCPASADQWVRMAIGVPATGITGFVRTHRHAMSAQTVALTAGERAAGITPYHVVASIAFLCKDLERAREWIADTLGGLSRDDSQVAQLRRTVAVFLDCGRSFTAAAERLQCHKNTVQYRIRRAEGLCGRPLRERQLDAELALLACEWLGAAVLDNAEK